MTKDEWLGVHASIAAAGGMLSGAISRNANSHRLTQDLLSLLRPAVRKLEIEELTFTAQAVIEERAKPQRQKRTRR